MQCPAGSGECGAEVPQLRVPVAQSLQVQLHVVGQVLGHEAHEVTGRAGRGVDIKIAPGHARPTAQGGQGCVTCCGPAPAASGAAAAGCGSGWRGERRDTAPCAPSLGHPPRLWAESPVSGILPSPSLARPPAPPRLTRVLVRPRPVHGVQQGGHQPVVGVLVGTDQVGEGAETLGLDALDGLGRQSRGSTITSPPLPGWPQPAVSRGSVPQNVPVVSRKCLLDPGPVG